MGKKTNKGTALDKKQVMEKRMMLEAFIKERVFCQSKKEFAKLLDIRESNFSPNFEKEYNKMQNFVLKKGHFPTLKENEQLYLRARYWWTNERTSSESQKIKADKLQYLGYVYNPEDGLTGDEYLNCLYNVSDKFIIEIWEKVKVELDFINTKYYNIDDQLKEIYKTIQMARILDALPLKSSIVNDKLHCRMELLRTYIRLDKTKRKELVKMYGFSEREMNLLNNQSDKRLIGLHAYYSYRYKLLNPSIELIYILCNEMKECFPYYKEDVGVMRNVMSDIIVPGFIGYYFFEYELVYLYRQKLRGHLDLYENPDNNIREIRNMDYFNKSFINEIMEDYMKECYVKDLLPDKVNERLTVNNLILMRSKDTPHRLYLLVKRGNIIISMYIFEKSENNRMTAQTYYLHKDKEEQLYMSEICYNKEHSGCNRYAITVTGSCSMDIQPLHPTEGSVVHLVEYEELLVPDTTKEVKVAIFEILSRLKEMIVWNVDISKELIKIAVYFKTKNVTQVYVRQMDKKSRIICMDNEITIDYVYDDFVFLWKDINIMIPFSEFSVRPYEKPNDEESEV